MRPAGQRVRLGTAHGAAQRRRIYQTAEALEMDEIGGFETSRRRVFFTEIVWVTLHRARTGAAVWVLAALAGLTLMAGFGLLAEVAELAYALFGLAAVLGLGAAFAATPVWVVTAHGRRTRIALRFRLREIRAHTVYGEICRLADTAQATLRRGEPSDHGAAGGAAGGEERLVGEEPEA
ncbi:MAG TPA: hypothetical protein VFE33_20320 [Thermoanaerobaculia bacterium]|nr:hypothetical protein [Thermoanaerobaculia bacterium]